MKKSKLVEGVEKKLGGVVIFAGSDSDREHIEALEKALDKYGIPYEVRIASAHKQPGVVTRLAKRYDAQPSPLVYIAVAGGTDALSGMLSFHSIRPVISCPPEYSAGRGVNQSCLTNPPGSSNAFCV
jgi:phosphoribosylaminoimidazole carboxylase PurE protein